MNDRAREKLAGPIMNKNLGAPNAEVGCDFFIESESRGDRRRSVRSFLHLLMVAAY